MWVGCHNHAAEFEDFGDRKAWDILYESTTKVVMQMDVGNALHAGVEALAFMRKYPGRQQSTHLKEWSASKEWPIIGDGDVDWQAVFEFCESAGDTRWYVVEFENQAYPALESVGKCLDFIRGLGR
jgi:sugar phosphate isomerase/epimerase